MILSTAVWCRGRRCLRALWPSKRFVILHHLHHSPVDSQNVSEFGFRFRTLKVFPRGAGLLLPVHVNKLVEQGTHNNKVMGLILTRKYTYWWKCIAANKYDIKAHIVKAVSLHPLSWTRRCLWIFQITSAYFSSGMLCFWASVVILTVRILFLTLLSCCTHQLMSFPRPRSSAPCLSALCLYLRRTTGKTSCDRY